MTGEKIKVARLAKGFTVVQLATILGCTTASVYYWEKGQKYPLPIFRKKLNELLGLDLK